MTEIEIDEFCKNMSAILQSVQTVESDVAKLTTSGDPRLIARDQLENLRQSAVIGDLLSPIDESWDVLAE